MQRRNTLWMSEFFYIDIMTDRKFQCGDCEFTTDYWQEMSKHIRRKHRERSTQNIRGEEWQICGETVKNVSIHQCNQRSWLACKNCRNDFQILGKFVHDNLFEMFLTKKKYTLKSVPVSFLRKVD